MDLLQSVRMSWRAIRGHPLRSSLTTLGVVIGVGAVITFVTLGASLQAGIIGEVAGEQPPVVNYPALLAPCGRSPRAGLPGSTTRFAGTDVVPVGSAVSAGVCSE